MTDPLLLAGVILLSLAVVGWAAYESGVDAGRKSHQCDDELALAMETASRTRHPSAQ